MNLKIYRSIGIWVMLAFLAVMGAGLILVIARVSEAAVQTEEAQLHQVLVNLARLSVALLGLDSVLFLWGVMRLVRFYWPGKKNIHKREYIDAWMLSGQRMKAPDESAGPDVEDYLPDKPDNE